MNFLQSSLSFHIKEKFNPRRNTWKKGIDNLVKLVFGVPWEAASLEGRFKLQEIWDMCRSSWKSKKVKLLWAKHARYQDGRKVQSGTEWLASTWHSSSAQQLWDAELEGCCIKYFFGPSSFIFILTSSDPGSRTLTVLASCSVTGCTNKAFPREKHKCGCDPQGCTSSEQKLCALGLSASHCHFRGLPGHGMCLGSLSMGEKKRHM